MYLLLLSLREIKSILTGKVMEEPQRRAPPPDGPVMDVAWTDRQQQFQQRVSYFETQRRWRSLWGVIQQSAADTSCDITFE